MCATASECGGSIGLSRLLFQSQLLKLLSSGYSWVLYSTLVLKFAQDGATLSYYNAFVLKYLRQALPHTTPSPTHTSPFTSSREGISRMSLALWGQNSDGIPWHIRFHYQMLSLVPVRRSSWWSHLSGCLLVRRMCERLWSRRFDFSRQTRSLKLVDLDQLRRVRGQIFCRRLWFNESSSLFDFWRFEWVWSSTSSSKNDIGLFAKIDRVDHGYSDRFSPR